MSDILANQEEDACAMAGVTAEAPSGPGAQAGPAEGAVLDSLLNTYYPAIVAFARRKLGNSHDAEDVAQETFAKIHQGLSGFAGRGRITTWLYTVGRNAVCSAGSRQGASVGGITVRTGFRTTPW